MSDVRAHPDINVRYLIFETQNKASGISEIEFDGEKTWPMQETGRQDAQDALDAGPGVYFEHFKDWSASYDLQKKYPYFKDYLDSLK